MNLDHNVKRVTGYGFVQDIKGAFKQVTYTDFTIYLNFTNFKLYHIFQEYMAYHSIVVDF